MGRDIYKLGEVYGIQRGLPLNYVARSSADDSLVENLTRDRHVVIYGSSKQGKTCLREHCLEADDYLTVHCSNNWQLEDLHEVILKRAGFKITQTETSSRTDSRTFLAEISASIFGSGAKGGAESTHEEGTEITKRQLQIDPSDVNDVIHALEEIDFEKFIVLEDFHYLPSDVQRDFAVALKAFHENSAFTFLIVGVWLEENRLIVLNGDLTGRVVSVNADEWSKDELKEVIECGERLLNISFDNDFKDTLLSECFDSVYIVQEVCYQACRQEKVFQTEKSEHPRLLKPASSVRSLIEEVVNEQNGRYNSFVMQFALGFQATELEMYKWILHPVLTSAPDELEQGLSLKHLRDKITDHHPRGADLNTGNLTQALQNSVALQNRKDIKPIILDYDQSNLQLTVVDKGFLIWLEHQDIVGLLETAGFENPDELL